MCKSLRYILSRYFPMNCPVQVDCPTGPILRPCAAIPCCANCCYHPGIRASNLTNQMKRPFMWVSLAILGALEAYGNCAAGVVGFLTECNQPGFLKLAHGLAFPHPHCSPSKKIFKTGQLGEVSLGQYHIDLIFMLLVRTLTPLRKSNAHRWSTNKMVRSIWI